MEADTKSLYVKRSGEKRIGKSNVFRTYYRCHRSGFYRNRDKEVSRRRKKGSAKVDGTCTSYITVERIDDKLNVTFCATHYRHATDEIEYLPLTKNERASVIEKVGQGLPFEAIVEDLFPDDLSYESERMAQRLTKQNVQTMANRSGFSSGDNEEDNARALEAWVDALCNTASSESPVRVFKPKQVESPELELLEDDFCLLVITTLQAEFLKIFGSNGTLCVDSTATSKSSDLNITSVFVVHDQGDAVPVAFMISNNQEPRMVNLYFETLKILVGEVQVQTFLSNDMDCFYAPWARVMGEANVKLLCGWQVKLDWLKNLDKVKDKYRRVGVFNLVKELMDKVDERAFLDALIDVQSQLLSDSKTAKYGTYFQENYSNQCELWASCYRQNIESRWLQSLEELHETIRKGFLSGRSNRKLDVTMDELLKLFRDRHFARERSISRTKLNEKSYGLKESHQLCLNLDLIVSEKRAGHWTVKSKGNPSEQYEIERLDAHPCCDVRCSECHVCPHMYACSCLESLIKGSVCEHIHYVMNWAQKRTRQGGSLESDVPSTSSEMFCILDGTELSKVQNLKAAKDRLKTVLQTCIGLIDLGTDKEQIFKSELLANAIEGLLRKKPLVNVQWSTAKVYKRARTYGAGNVAKKPHIVKVETTESDDQAEDAEQD